MQIKREAIRYLENHSQLQQRLVKRLVGRQPLTQTVLGSAFTNALPKMKHRLYVITLAPNEFPFSFGEKME
jgi:hypothetical protein